MDPQDQVTTEPERVGKESAKTQDELVPVAAFRRATRASEYGLVILAMGHSYTQQARGGCHTLYVREEHAKAIQEELRRYAKQRPLRLPRLPPTRPRAKSWRLGAALYGLFLAGVFWAQTSRGDALVDAGAVRAMPPYGAVEFARAWTALTLHADMAHLLSNLISSALLLMAVASVFGAGAGLLGAVLGGAAGNLVAAVLRESGSALGASTAVFAMLGLLVGRVVGGRREDAEALPKAPALFAGLGLLAFWGMGGPEIDVLGHVTGAVGGAVFGAIAGRAVSASMLDDWRMQAGAGVAALAQLLIAWAVVLSIAG